MQSVIAVSRRKIQGPYCKVFTNTCAHCSCKFVYRNKRKFCQLHEALYGREGRNKYAFTFNPFLYEDIFGANLLTQITDLGMWSPNNHTGLTRDHKVSVNEAIKNQYDPYFIKHPINCEYMTWTENNKKKTKSSLSYEALVRQVAAYDSHRGGYLPNGHSDVSIPQSRRKDN